VKLLLVAAGDEAVQALGDRLAPLGYTVEHSAEPVRAIANLDDIDPQAILFSAADFPRHWKAMLKVVRERWDRKQLPFVVAAPADLEIEEAAKAAHLGANGIVGAEPARAEELSRIEMILRRAREGSPVMGKAEAPAKIAGTPAAAQPRARQEEPPPAVEDKRNFERVAPHSADELAFAFTHPQRLALVTGAVREVSIQGASFLPLRPASVQDLEVGAELPRCSLRAGESLIGLDCRLTRNGTDVGLQFLSFAEGGHHALLAWIQSRGAVSPAAD
jgi:hypothetical protein